MSYPLCPVQSETDNLIIKAVLNEQARLQEEQNKALGQKYTVLYYYTPINPVWEFVLPANWDIPGENWLTSANNLLRSHQGLFLDLAGLGGVGAPSLLDLIDQVCGDPESLEQNEVAPLPKAVDDMKNLIRDATRQNGGDLFSGDVAVYFGEVSVGRGAMEIACCVRPVFQTRDHQDLILEQHRTGLLGNINSIPTLRVRFY